MTYDVIVVGSGASGLTSAAYLSKAGYKTLLLEKEQHLGGLVNTFTKDGFKFDGGIRALDDAGALFPMLKQLGIEIDFLENPISIGIEDQVLHVNKDPHLTAYEKLLADLYPQSTDEIAAILSDIKEIMRAVKTQYGIKNPIFLDVKEDREYFIKVVLPWVLKYVFAVRKLSKKNDPVEDYLLGFTQNQSLVDIIAQHFFTQTPAFFALSYFNTYQDYVYPREGTGVFIEELTNYIKEQGGQIQTSAAVTAINLEKKRVTTQDGAGFDYRCLVWTADQKTLYEMVDSGNLTQPDLIEAIREKKALLADKTGNDSVLTVYVSSNLDKDYFADIATGHFFYTPSREGESKAGRIPVSGTREEIERWLEGFFALTTYEISIPALRDESMAPAGKTGLIISVLFDYELTKTIYDQGWEAEFRDLITRLMIENLDKTIYPGLDVSVIETFTATPMTIQKMTGTTDGAITGWGFDNQPMPAESRLIKIASSVNTPLPDVYQAGQWTYSPSGLPISLITGKLAADKVNKRLKK